MKNTHNVLFGVLLVIALLLLAECTFLQRNPSEKRPTVAFCDLINNPTKFHNKIVRTNALFFNNSENNALYDSACPDLSAWVEYDLLDDPRERKFETVPCLTRPLCNVRVTAVGLFQGPSEGPYGHLDGYKFRFKLMRIESVEPVAVLKKR